MSQSNSAQNSEQVITRDLTTAFFKLQVDYGVMACSSKERMDVEDIDFLINGFKELIDILEEARISVLSDSALETHNANGVSNDY